MGSPRSIIARNAQMVFNTLKAEINTAMLNHPEFKQFRRAELGCQDRMTSQLTLFSDSNKGYRELLGYWKAGIEHVITAINIVANDLKIPAPTDIEIANCSQSQKLFLNHVLFNDGMSASTTFKITGLIGEAFVALGMAGYEAYSFYSSPDLAGAKNAKEDIACWIAVSMLAINLARQSAQSEKIKFMESLFGDRFETVKTFCAQYYDLKNENVVIHDDPLAASLGSDVRRATFGR